MSNPKMQNLEPLYELFSSYYKHLLKISFSVNASYCLTKFCRKNLLIASLIRNDSVDFGYFFSQFPDTI